MTPNRLIPYTLTPAARMREAERLRHMARRAYAIAEAAPVGLTQDQYAMRLERQAMAQSTLARRH